MNSLISKTIFAVVVMTNLSSFAQSLNTSSKTQQLRSAKSSQSAARGGVATGGGDICEDRIKSIRSDLRTWIVAGGADALELPANIKVATYEEKMLHEISNAKIRCVGEGDDGYPIEVNGFAKGCRFDRNGSDSLITCDFKKFLSLKDDEQYTLVHHEYAGLADIEIPNGSDSDYSVSNQISNYLVETVVKKLAVKFDGKNFKTVPKEKINAYKRSIPWKNQVFKSYEQSEGWYVSSFMGLTYSPEDIVANAESLKVLSDGKKIKLMFEYRLAGLKNITVITIENKSVTNIRTELHFLAAQTPDPSNGNKMVDGWKTIGWESCY